MGACGEGMEGFPKEAATEDLENKPGKSVIVLLDSHNKMGRGALYNKRVPPFNR